MVFACDGRFAMQLATTLRSISEANENGWPLDVHVLTDDFPICARMKVQESLPIGAAFIRWIQIDLEPFRELSVAPHIASKMTFARLLVPQLFPEVVQRILYLDADILVLGDLRPLWELELGGAVVGAVSDALDPLRKNDASGLEGLPNVKAYFNAGVLLIDLPQWREQRISERAIAYLAQHPQSPFSDQDALNVACDGLWKELDSKWNFQNHFEARIAQMPPMDRPAILHFITSQKPWKPSSLSVNTRLYDAFRSRTRFARTRRDRMSDAVQRLWRRIKRRMRRFLEFP